MCDSWRAGGARVSPHRAEQIQPPWALSPAQGPKPQKEMRDAEGRQGAVTTWLVWKDFRVWARSRAFLTTV